MHLPPKKGRSQREQSLVQQQNDVAAEGQQERPAGKARREKGQISRSDNQELMSRISHVDFKAHQKTMMMYVQGFEPYGDVHVSC